MKRTRGRPRAFSEEDVLRRAMETFWTAGFAATSLDDLSEATGLGRPSLYAAFGDKESLYLKALAFWTREMANILGAALRAGRTVEEGLLGFYQAAIVRYRTGVPRGCLVTCTAASEGVEHPAIQAAFREILEQVDTALEQFLRHHGADSPQALSRQAAATMHSLALRARAGQPEQLLLAMAGEAASLLAKAALC